ncbi:hypothetical protein ACTFTM_05265 [Micromonospora sp. RB23]
MVDRLKGSIFHHMKELRPGSAGSTEIRMIFAFDPVREQSSWSLETNRVSGRVGTGRRSLSRTTDSRSTSQG